MTDQDIRLNPLLAPEFVDVHFDLSFSLVTIKKAPESLESRDCVEVMPPTPSQPGWVVRMGYANDNHAELAGRREAVGYLVGRMRPAVASANEYFSARDAMRRAEESGGPVTSRLAAEVYEANRLLEQCAMYGRGDGFGV